MSNTISLKASAISALLESRVINQIQNPSNKLRPLFIKGHRGVGKSSLIRQTAKNVGKALGLSVDVKTITLSAMEPPDFNGLGENVKINDKLVTQFGRPVFLPEDGYGILFIDEGNRPNLGVSNTLLTLIEDREINGHKLGAGWAIVFAGNPMGNDDGADRYQTEQLDAALMDRMAFVDFKGDSNETISYLETKYPSHFMIDFLKNNRDFICMEGIKKTSPRSIEYAIRATLDVPVEKAFHPLAVELGGDAASIVVEFVKNNIKDIELKTILNDRKKTQKWIADNKDDSSAMTLISDKIAGEISRRFASKDYTKEHKLAGEFCFLPKERWNIANAINELPPENIQALTKLIAYDENLHDFNVEHTFFIHFCDINEKGQSIGIAWDKHKKIIKNKAGKEVKNYHMNAFWEIVRTVTETKHPEIVEKI